jgi:hypothetical protein
MAPRLSPVPRTTPCIMRSYPAPWRAPLDPWGDRPLSTEEWEFARAMYRYQHQTGRRYPAWSEVLAVLHALGYRREPRPPSPPPPPGSS